MPATGPRRQTGNHITAERIPLNKGVIVAGYPALNRILYVDDEPHLLEIGKTFLESDWAFVVDTSLSAPEAMERMKSTGYDAIVSDYQMPKMDGIAFLKSLRAGGDKTPFIIFTGRGREEVAIEALNSGADFYLQKGGDPVAQYAELAYKIHHAISRKHAIRDLERSEQDYRRLIEHANEAIFIIQDGYFRMVNPKSAEISGYAQQELMNQPFTLFAHPDDRDTVLDRFRRRISGEDVPARITFRITRKDGAVRWAELNVVSLLWDGRPATLNFLNDITERKLAEDALRESEERYRQFFRTSRDAMFITTQEGQYIDFNDALMGQIGAANREEVFGMNVADFYAHPENRAVFLARVRRDGFVWDHPVQFRRRNGDIFDALLSVAPLKKPDGSIRAFIGTVRDLTGIRNRTAEEERDGRAG